jgi:hypothetical protein
MDFSGGSPHDRSAASGEARLGAEWAQFTPLVFSGCLGWVRICAPHGGARAACLAITAHIHLMSPGTPLRELDALAEPAIRALEDGAASVTVIDACHRVDRSGLCPQAAPPASA